MTYIVEKVYTKALHAYIEEACTKALYTRYSMYAQDIDECCGGVLKTWNQPSPNAVGAHVTCELYIVWPPGT